MRGEVTGAARRAARLPGFVYESVRDDGVAGLRYVRNIGSDIAVTGLSHLLVDAGFNPGESIWEREWDVLVVLDACRVDLMREIAHEYPFVGVVGEFTSLASKSSDWLLRTFDEAHAEDVRRTAYVTGNPYTAKVDLPVEPAVHDEVWRYAWDDDLHTVPPRPMTDRAIDTWRGRGDEFDRMVVHYMQPHGPFVDHPDIGEYGTPDDFGEGFGNLWGRTGIARELPRETIWRAYRDNLRLVMDDVSLLLSNLAAEEVVLTADHGNAVGEWGVYGHPADVLLPCIRNVPWVRTRGRDDGEYDPELEPPERADDGAEDGDVADRLRALGYTE